jgi:hypothetical protein
MSGITRIAILSYSYLYVFDKLPNESYAQVLSRAPQVVPLKRLPQAEAVALSHAGRVVTVFSEGLATPILQWSLPLIGASPSVKNVVELRVAK